jgi:hypothetical protein
MITHYVGGKHDSEPTIKEADCTDTPDQRNNSTRDILSSMEEMQYMHAKHGITVGSYKQITSTRTALYVYFML